MEHSHHLSPQCHSVAEKATSNSHSVKMGSNVYTADVVGPRNGTIQPGVITTASRLGKQSVLLTSFSQLVPEEGEPFPQQNHTSTISLPVSSLSHPHLHAEAISKPKEVAQAMTAALNGHMKNCSSMDHHHHAGRNVIRPEPRSVAPQPHQSQHLHNLNHHPPQNYQPAFQQQATATSGTTMRGLVVDGSDYIMERPMFLAPGSAPALRSHAMATTSSGESVVAPESSPPPTSYTEGEPKTFGRKRSRKRPKTCGVCGDRAKSFHFGGLSCDSCKAFFRRSVQNDAHVAFRCAYDSCCDINISTRKSCQFCRFKKCISIGMEKSWVMTEEERNALNQQRLEKKQRPIGTVTNAQQQQYDQESLSPDDTPPQQQQQQPPLQFLLQQQQPQQHQQAPSTPSSTTSSTALPESSYTFQGSTTSAAAELPGALAFQESEYVADVDQMLDYMTYEDQLEIKSVVETYLHAYKEMPFRVSFEEGRRDTLEIIEMFTTILRRFAYFAKLIPDFSALGKNDQGNLLRAAVLEMCLLRGAACFDTENNRWPNSTMESLKNCPQLRVEDMQRLVSRELFEMHITFIFHMKRLRIDEPIAMLLIMTVLFSPEHIPVEDKIKISQAQEKYLMLLKKYVTWKFGATAGSRIYPQLLTKLSDLRQLNDFHTEFHLNLDRKEVNAIRKSLMELHLNPYPNWNIVPESRQSSPEESPAPTPVMPSPSPMLEAGSSSMPMMAQRLLQTFADSRIPTLLDNPYSEFETDLGMIRHVQQTLGSLFPSPGQAPAFTTNAQSTQQQQRRYPTDADSTTTGKHFAKGYPLLSSAKSKPCPGPESSISSRYSSSTDSAEAAALDILEPTSTSKFQAPSTSSSSSQFDNIPPVEYHTERLHQFLHHRAGGSSHASGFETVTSSVIQGLHPSAGPSDLPSGSQQPQTVLRKHSSTGSSLPGTHSVIRSAPARTVGSSVSSSTEGIQPISCNSVPVSGGGWHGGEVTTTTNGHSQPTETGAMTVTTRIRPPTLYDDPDEEEMAFRKN